MKGVLNLTALSLLLAACAGTPPATPSPTASPTIAPIAAPTASPTDAPTASPTRAPTASPTFDASPVAEGIPVHMSGNVGPTGMSFFYSPASITAPAGDVTFLLVNDCNCAAHNFILGPDKPVCTSSGCTFGPVIAKSPAVRAGSVPFTVEGLAAGTYAYWCTIADHAQLGMTGTLTMTP